MENKYIVTINNKRIFDFYNSNPNINIESMNIILLDIIEELSTDMTKLFVNTKLGEINENVKELKQSLVHLNDSLSIKLNESNKNFIETIKLVVENTNNENNEKVSQLLNKNIDIFINQISLIIPKSQDESNKKLQENLSHIHKTLTDDVKTFMLTTHNASNLKDFVSTIESKIQVMQQPIFNFITSSQESLYNKINSVKEDNLVTKANNEKLYTELNDFLNKYKNSSQFKGQLSENMLEHILCKLYPTAEINNTTSHTACGDFMMKRENKCNILFENKNYDSNNVNIEEVKKFLRDTQLNKCSGVMMSQKSGIVGRPDYHIEIHDGNILMYLHNVNYSHEKIKTAVDVIDNMYEKLQMIYKNEDTEGIQIKKEVLDSINEEFQRFIIQKEGIINSAKDIQKKIISQVEELRMPELTTFLNSKYASIQNQQFICDICGLSFPNNRSLGSHKKLHKEKSNSKQNTNEKEIIISA
jgi:rubrerythrin